MVRKIAPYVVVFKWISVPGSALRSVSPLRDAERRSGRNDAGRAMLRIAAVEMTMGLFRESALQVFDGGLDLLEASLGEVAAVVAHRPSDVAPSGPDVALASWR